MCPRTPRQAALGAAARANAAHHSEMVSTLEMVDAFLRGDMTRKALGSWFETTARQPALAALTRTGELVTLDAATLAPGSVDSAAAAASVGYAAAARGRLVTHMRVLDMRGFFQTSLAVLYFHALLLESVGRALLAELSALSASRPAELSKEQAVDGRKAAVPSARQRLQLGSVREAPSPRVAASHRHTRCSSVVASAATVLPFAAAAAEGRGHAGRSAE